MKVAQILAKTGFSFAKRKRGDKVSALIHRTLVKSLYANTTGLIIGGVPGACAAAISAWTSGLSILWIGTALLALITLTRVGLAVFVNKKWPNASTMHMEVVYEIGAFTYSLLLGIIAAITIWYEIDAQVVMVTNALCYGVAVSSRNAGRPTIAIGQMALVALPIITASIAVGSLISLTLVGTTVFLLPAMTLISFNIFNILRSSIAAAETNADLAEKMQTLARTDVVTGIANRAGLNHSIVEALMEVNENSRLALIWIDLDRFKEVNDLLGHPVGDRVLVEISRRLLDACPKEAIVSRFGGDEFIIFTPIANRKEAERICSEIHTEIMRTIRADGHRLEVRASLGVATLPEDGTDADTLMQRADLALYHAKMGGRAQTCFFTQSMTRDLVRRSEIEGELRLAIQHDELSIFFQPIVDLATGRIRSFEALVRWFHPEKGEILPNEFIPVAEESGVIVTLGNWITVQAARIASHWPEDITLAVNLSPLQIRAPGASLGIKNALREAGLDPHRLELEVTESLFVDNNHATAHFIEELSEIGVKFALDDFGTGYSSLGYINTFPFNKIKVDRSFVSGKQVGRKSDAIIRAVAEMGATLEMEIVAEGLETMEQVDAVRAAGCTLGQGFYFSRAVPDYLATMLIAQERESDSGKDARQRAAR